MALVEWKIKLSGSSEDSPSSGRRCWIIHSCTWLGTRMFHSDICVQCNKQIPKDILKLRNFVNLSTSKEVKERFLLARKNAKQSLEGLL